MNWMIVAFVAATVVVTVVSSGNEKNNRKREMLREDANMNLPEERGGQIKGSCWKPFGQCMPKNSAEKKCKGKIDVQLKCSSGKQVCCIDLQEVNIADSQGIAKASSSFNTNFGPSKAYDGSGFWTIGSPYTLPVSWWVEFPKYVKIGKFSFTSRTDEDRWAQTDGPTQYIFWASNAYDCTDESRWVKLHEDNSGIPFDTKSTQETTMIKNNGYFRCYGFKYTDSPGRILEGNFVKPISIANIRYYEIQELQEVNIADSQGIAKASSSFNTNFGPNKAYDGSGFWSSGSPYTLPVSWWVEFPKSVKIVQYSFTSRTDAGQYAQTDGPTKYKFWASNAADCTDESKRVTILEDNSGTPFDADNHLTPKSAMINNNHKFMCYGFTFTDSPGRNLEGNFVKPISIANIRFYELQELQEMNIAESQGIAKASSNYTDYFGPNKAFDGSGFWSSGFPFTLPQTWWVEFPIYVKIVKFSFTSRTDEGPLAVSDGPTKYIFWASNADDCTDESKWVMIFVDNTGTSFDEIFTPKSAMIRNNYYYRCYGFKYTDSPGRNDGNPISIANIRFYEIQEA